jgi:hypothetical protein
MYEEQQPATLPQWDPTSWDPSGTSIVLRTRSAPKTTFTFRAATAVDGERPEVTSHILNNRKVANIFHHRKRDLSARSRAKDQLQMVVYEFLPMDLASIVVVLATPDCVQTYHDVSESSWDEESRQLYRQHHDTFPGFGLCITSYLTSLPTDIVTSADYVFAFVRDTMDVPVFLNLYFPELLNLYVAELSRFEYATLTYFELPRSVLVWAKATPDRLAVFRLSNTHSAPFLDNEM